MAQVFPYLASGFGLIFVLLIVDLVRQIHQRAGETLANDSDFSAGLSSPFVLGGASSEAETQLLPPETEPTLQGDRGLSPDTSELTRTELELGHYEEKHLVIHTDFDGLTSGAMLLRALGSKVEIFFASPRGFHQVLQNLAISGRKGSAVFIADLGVSNETGPELLSAVRKLHAQGLAIMWYDHHQWAESYQESIRPYCQELIVDPRFTTAAELIRNRLLGNDEYADRLLAFLRNRAAEQWPQWDTDWRDLLTELQTADSRETRISSLNKFAFDQPLSVLDRMVLRRGRQRRLLTEEIASYEHPKIETKRGLTLLIIDVRTFRYERTPAGKRLFVMQRAKPSMMVGKLACERWAGDFCLILWRNNRYSLYRGINPRLDFGGLLGPKTYSPYHYQIAGHRYAVGITVKVKLLHSLRSTLNWNLIPETVRLIEALQEEF